MSNFTGLAKIQKINNEEPDEFEKSISQALLNLEMNSDMKAHLRELHIKAAKEVDVGGKRAIVIFVPPPQLKSFQKVQTRLVRELEKKFAGKAELRLWLTRKLHAAITSYLSMGKWSDCLKFWYSNWLTMIQQEKTFSK